MTDKSLYAKQKGKNTNMLSLNLYLDGKSIEVAKTDISQVDSVVALSEFQVLANAELTKLIESMGEASDDTNLCEEGDDSDEEIQSEQVPGTPKKRKT